MGITLLGLVIVAFSCVILLTFATQVVIPVKNGTPLFPFFRKETPLKKLVDEAEMTLEEQTELARLNEQLAIINRRKAELEKE